MNSGIAGASGGGAASDGETAAGAKRGAYVIFSLAEFDPSKGPS